MRRMIQLGLAVGAVCALARVSSVPAVAQGAPPTRSVRSGVYTPDQATRGKSAYGVFCAGCHGDDLAGSNSADSGAPPLKRSNFMSGSNVDALFTKVQSTMPLEAPGALKDSEYLEVLAYLLEQNGFPAGAEPLKMDREELRRILIEAAPEPK
jgi:quinoprotein glucose dehydrogenase